MLVTSILVTCIWGSIIINTCLYVIASLPKAAHSTKGLGKFAPDAKSYVKLDNDVLVPIGKVKKSGHSDSDLLYNE